MQGVNVLIDFYRLVASTCLVVNFRLLLTAGTSHFMWRMEDVGVVYSFYFVSFHPTLYMGV